MDKMLFREKSIEKITSPEQLNERIRVASPSVWMMLLGISFVLVGICIWGVFGRIDTVIPVGAITKEEQTVCYVKAEYYDRLTSELIVRTNEDEYRIQKIASTPILVDENIPDYLCHVGNLKKGEWVYEVTLNEICGVPESIIQADLVIESIAPMSFVIN